MKTLKKVLSLVLVVAMIASMCIVGAAAAEETNYPEAASVITGIKVMEGDERGMRYGDTVTRAEAAAIICRLLLGDTAETLKTTTAPFADVKAGDWFAPYVTYLKGLGVVSGVGGNNYAPNANVTGLQFAKMLLVAVGYNQMGEYEGDVNPAWDINILTDAYNTGIYEGTKAVDLVDTPATREECMLYAFNTLLVPTVKYNKTFESYYTGKSAIDPAEDNELIDYTLAALKFNLEKDTENVTDVFGRPAANYVIGNDVLVEKTLTSAPDFELTNTVYGADLYAKLGATAKKVDKIVTYVDGADPVVETDAADIAALLSPYHSAAYHATPITGTGAHVEGYVSVDGEDTILTLVIWYEYLSSVASIHPITGVATLQSGATGIIENAVQYAWTVYTTSAKATPYSIVSGAVAVPGSGVFQKIDAQGNYVFDGVAYAKSAVAASAVLPTTANTGAPYYIYTDSLGNLLGVYAVDTTVKSSDYVYVTDAVITPAQGGIGGTAQVAKLEVVYATGGYAIVDYTVTTDIQGNPAVLLPGDTLVTAIKDYDDEIVDGWYSYIKAEDGSITLLDLVDYIGDDAEGFALTTEGLSVAKGKFLVSDFYGYKATGATVLNVVDQTGKVETYKGIANFPASVEDNEYIVMVELDPYYNILAINAYGEDASIAPSYSDTIYGYVVEYLYEDVNGYHYNVAVNGAIVEIYSSEIAPVTTVGEDTVYTAGKVFEVAPLRGLYWFVEELDTVDYSDYDAENAGYDNTVSALESTYITVVDVDGSFPNTYYYNADPTNPTTVIDLANNGAVGTLALGRRATVAYEVVGTEFHALYIFLH